MSTFQYSQVVQDLIHIDGRFILINNPLSKKTVGMSHNYTLKLVNYNQYTITEKIDAFPIKRPQDYVNVNGSGH